LIHDGGIKNVITSGRWLTERWIRKVIKNDYETLKQHASQILSPARQRHRFPESRTNTAWLTQPIAD
jgi:hypothetical protein